MADIRKLHEQRAQALTQATSLVADLAEKGEALEGESQARFEKLTAEASTIAAAIRSEKEAAEARTAADSARAEFAAVIAPAAKADRDEAAETLVAVLIDNDVAADEIKSVFKSESDIKRALASYLKDHAEEDEDEEEFNDNDGEDEDY